MKPTGLDCIVCGRFIPYLGAKLSEFRLAAHECPPRVIGGLENASRRAWDPQPGADPMLRPVSERLDEGFAILAREGIPA